MSVRNTKPYGGFDNTIEKQFTSFKQKSQLEIAPRQLYSRNPLYDPVRKSQQNENIIFEKTKEQYNNLNSYKNKNISHLYSQNNIFNQENNKPDLDEINMQKVKLKKTALGERPSHVFNLNNEYTDDIEKKYKPLAKKMQLKESESYDCNVKNQFKKTEYTLKQTQSRNPILEGDPKSEYNRNLRVSKDVLPRDQFFF